MLTESQRLRGANSGNSRGFQGAGFEGFRGCFLVKRGLAFAAGGLRGFVIWGFRLFSGLGSEGL